MNLTSILNELGPDFEKNAPLYDQENQFAENNFLALKERGVYKALIPHNCGGAGVAYQDLCYFLKDLAKFCPSTALTLSMHQHLIAVLTFKSLHGDIPATKTLEMVAEKDLVLLSTGGADWVSSNGTATKVAGGYKINCHKSFCSGSPIADIAVMSCAFDDGTQEHVLHFSTALRAPGVKIANDWDAMGMKATGSNSIMFEDVFIPDEKISLMRERGKWHPIWDIVSTLAFPVFMAPYAGIAEKITEKTIALYANKKNPSSFSKSRIGEMHNHYQITKWAIDDMVDSVKNFDLKPDSHTASKALQAKSLISKHGRDCAQLAMEALGGFSYYKDTGIERLYRDFLASEFHPMQAAKQTEAMGEHLLGGTLAIA